MADSESLAMETLRAALAELEEWRSGKRVHPSASEAGTQRALLWEAMVAELGEEVMTESFAQSIARDALALRKIVAAAESSSKSHETRFTASDRQGCASLSILAEIGDAAMGASNVADAVIEGIAKAQKSWNDDIEIAASAEADREGHQERAEAWDLLVLSLGVSTTDPLYFGAALARCGITRRPCASIEDIGEEIASRLGRVS